MSETTDEPKDTREPWSFERLIKELEDTRRGLEDQVWRHVKALASIPGHGISEYPTQKITKKEDAETPVPMIHVFSLAVEIKEMVNQVDIALNNLGHELVPDWYMKSEQDIKE